MGFRTSLLLVTAMVASVFASERVYMPLFELVNIHDDYQYATSKIFQRYAAKDGRYEVVIPNQTDSLQAQPSKAEVQKIASSKGCTKFILADLTRLGETVVVTVSLYGTQSGNLLWSDAMKAANPNDLDPILERMAKNIGTENVASKTDDIYTVTQKEETKLRKKRANKSFGFGIMGFTMLNNPGPRFQPGLEIFWSYDSRNIFFQIDGSFNFYSDSEDYTRTDYYGESYKYSIDETTVNLSLGLSGYYPLFDGNTTPFLGGGLSFTSTIVEYSSDYYYYDEPEDDSKTGLWVRLGGGILFNRTSTVTFRIRAEYAFSTYKVDHHIMHGPQVGLEIGF
ncbi:MAG: hypothetical protein J6Z31_06175 [Fibrobacter sp.]|nr:hypothetical protein [Fibrobacter sp.]